MRGQAHRGWEGERKQASGATVRCKRGREGGKTAEMMEEKCHSCMSAGFALQYRPPIPRGLSVGLDWNQRAATCTGSILPFFSAPIFQEIIHIFKLYNHTTQSQGTGRFQVCYLALYHDFTLEMSFLPLHNSS